MNLFFASVGASKTAQHAVQHAAEHAPKAQETHLELLNFIHLITKYIHGTPLGDLLHRFENILFTYLIIAFLGTLAYLASRNAKLVPGRLQSAFESIVSGLDGFVCGILGPEGRKYTPFLGTLFLYIWTMNMTGLVPLMKSPTGTSMTLSLGALKLPIPTVTVALAILVFLYVQYIGIKKNGILGYLDHMAGTPRDVFGFVLLPIMFVIHVIGEFAKPLSLSFRLYGNIWGEDVLLAVFVGLGIGALAFLPIPAGVPLHAPFVLLAMVTGTIQAFVFTLLSTVYIAMMLPHDDHAHEEAPHGKPAHV
jgi:F-type H+-transporting ATPase subunit a